MEPAPLHTDIADGPPGGEAFWVTARDGIRLRLALWARGRRGTVMLLPGRTETIEKYGKVAAHLAASGYGVATIDWRGQGLSQRLAPDRSLGHVNSFAEYQMDLAQLRAAAAAFDLARPHVMLAHSMGGCIGLRALIDGWPQIEAAAFSAPMWGLPMSSRLRIAARAMGLVARATGRTRRPIPNRAEEYSLVRMPFEGNLLTGDRAMFDHLQNQIRAHPELGLGAPSMGWLSAALREMRALARRPSPALPALLAVGSRERIVEIEAIRARARTWPSSRLLICEGAEHELMMETPRHREAFIDAAMEVFSARTVSA